MNAPTQAEALPKVVYELEAIPEWLINDLNYTPEPHQQRVIEEVKQVHGNMGKLAAYLNSQAFDVLDKTDGFLLRKQYSAMADYVNVLLTRLTRWREKAAVVPDAQLFTRDGRVTGNAIVVMASEDESGGDPLYWVQTDFGHVSGALTLQEVLARWTPLVDGYPRQAEGGRPGWAQDRQRVFAESHGRMCRFNELLQADGDETIETDALLKLWQQSDA